MKGRRWFSRNPNFKGVEFAPLRAEAGINSHAHMQSLLLNPAVKKLK